MVNILTTRLKIINVTANSYNKILELLPLIKLTQSIDVVASLNKMFQQEFTDLTSIPNKWLDENVGSRTLEVEMDNPNPLQETFNEIYLSINTEWNIPDKYIFELSKQIYNIDSDIEVLTRTFIKKNYYQQQISVIDDYINNSSFEFFKRLVMGKKVLHVGFVDYPITNIKKNLHLQLSPYCEVLDGFDINLEHSLELAVPNGKFLDKWEDISDEYDIIIIPEVLEHVDNVQLFLKNLDRFTSKIVISVPDAYLLQRYFQYDQGYEEVHPDHNCWYSAYTLKNVISKYTNKHVDNLYWINNHSIVAIFQ